MRYKSIFVAKKRNKMYISTRSSAGTFRRGLICMQFLEMFATRVHRILARNMCAAKDPEVIAHRVALAHAQSLTASFNADRASASDDLRKLQSALKADRELLARELKEGRDASRAEFAAFQKDLKNEMKENRKEMERELKALWTANNYKVAGLIIVGVCGSVMLAQQFGFEYGFTGQQKSKKM